MIRWISDRNGWFWLCFHKQNLYMKWYDMLFMILMIFEHRHVLNVVFNWQIWTDHSAHKVLPTTKLKMIKKTFKNVSLLFVLLCFVVFLLLLFMSEPHLFLFNIVLFFLTNYVSVRALSVSLSSLHLLQDSSFTVKLTQTQLAAASVSISS